MRKPKMTASYIRRMSAIAEILDITFMQAEELSECITASMKEIKEDFDHPNVEEIIQNLADEKSLTKAIEHDRN